MKGSPLTQPLNLDIDGQPPPSYPDHVHSPKMDQVHSSSGSLFERRDPDLRERLKPDLPGLQPYLGLHARLFLSLLSPPLISILFTGAHLLFSSKEVGEKVTDSKATLLRACYEAERQASIAASLPRYMADSMNQRTQQTIEATVHGMGKVIYMTLTALEAVITFVVDSYRSVFLCFIELLVRSSLSLLAAAVDLINGIINDASHGIKAAIQAGVDGVNAFLHGALDGINDVISVIGKSIQIPVVAQPNLSALDNVRLPASFDEGLRKLNDSLPTLSELREKINALIEQPFEQMKEDVNGSE